MVLSAGDRELGGNRVDEDGGAWSPSLIYTAQLWRVSLAVQLPSRPADLNSMTRIFKFPGPVHV